MPVDGFIRTRSYCNYFNGIIRATLFPPNYLHVFPRNCLQFTILGLKIPYQNKDRYKTLVLRNAEKTRMFMTHKYTSTCP